MENPLRNLGIVERMEERQRKFKKSISRNIGAPVVASMRLGHLDLAIKGDDYMRILIHSSNIEFLEGPPISSALTTQEDKNLVERFMDDRSFLDCLIRRRSTRVIHRVVKTIFYDYVDRGKFHIHKLYRIGYCFKLDQTAKKTADAYKYRTQNRKILDKLLLQHSRCHFCALSYIRILYPSKYFLHAFLCDINRPEVLEYFLKMTIKAGVDIWGPSELGEFTCDPILYFMSVQKYPLVHTLIDYGYTIRLVTRQDTKFLILGLFGHYSVTCRPVRNFERLFREEPVETIMILYALCASLRAPGFLSAYKRLHKSLGLPHYSTSYIRAYLRKILDVPYYQMIEERCYSYKRCGFEQYPECTPRSLLDLATCAYRNVLKRLPCGLPTAISQLEFPDHLKDLVALKT